MKKLSFVVAFLLLVIFQVESFSQGSAGLNAKFEYRYLVDMPTAGVLDKGLTSVSLNLLPMGTFIGKIEVGVFPNFSLGLSYGAGNFISRGKINWYELPGMNLRLRVIDETLLTPAFTLGFDSQGKGLYSKDLKRYEIKSPGFFAAVSKNFELLGYLSLHGTINYSLERKDGDKDINLGIGVEKTLGGSLSLLAEYDFAINDNHAAAFGDGNGYLNLGFRWSLGNEFTLGFDIRNVLENNKFTTDSADRAIYIEYLKAIF